MTGAQAGKILVIRHGALGDFVLSTGAFAAIRNHHGGAEITLLTGSAFVAFARASPWFDAIWARPAVKRGRVVPSRGENHAQDPASR